jgi:hypothetical protein
MFKQIIDGINATSTNIFSTIQDITLSVTNYQNTCWYIYETGSSDLSGGFLQDAFTNAQSECTNTNDFYLAQGIKTNFKIIGYQFANTQTTSGKMYCYFVIQDFNSAQVSPILY